MKKKHPVLQAILRGAQKGGGGKQTDLLFIREKSGKIEKRLGMEDI